MIFILFLFFIAMAFVLKSLLLRRHHQVVYSSPASKAPCCYVPFSDAVAENSIVVDCTHPTQRTFTHHKGHNNHPDIPPADTSTALVLNALESEQLHNNNNNFSGWLDKPTVTVNHFDGDALFSTWAYIHREEALRHAALLRCAAALHDFREVILHEEDIICNSSTPPPSLSLSALSLCCWINAGERSRFTPAYEDKDADAKFEYFLAELGPFLATPEKYSNIYQTDVDAVLADYTLVVQQGSLRKYHDVGLAVVQTPRPILYYSLFSHTLGSDVVLSIIHQNSSSSSSSSTMASGGSGGGAVFAFEVEEKYTQFVNVYSRPVVARLDMTPLAHFLNEVDSGRAAGTAWETPSMVDTGPLLRLDVQGKRLSKAQRYGQPTARPMLHSGLSAHLMEAVVVSFFRFGLRDVAPKVGGWSWDELHAVNRRIDWERWAEETRRELF